MSTADYCTNNMVMDLTSSVWRGKGLRQSVRGGDGDGWYCDLGSEGEVLQR